MLIGQQGVSAHAAYTQLRARARAGRRKLAIVSAEVIRSALSRKTTGLSARADIRGSAGSSQRP